MNILFFFEDLNIFKHHETTVAIEFIHHFFGASKSCERHSALEDFQQDMCVSPWDVRQIVSMLEIGAWRPAIFGSETHLGITRLTREKHGAQPPRFAIWEGPDTIFF